jgi:hypothetical protein
MGKKDVSHGIDSAVHHVYELNRSMLNERSLQPPSFVSR